MNVASGNLLVANGQAHGKTKPRISCRSSWNAASSSIMYEGIDRAGVESHQDWLRREGHPYRWTLGKI